MTKLFVTMFLLSLTAYAVDTGDDKGIEDKIGGVIEVKKEDTMYNVYFSEKGYIEIKEICREALHEEASRLLESGENTPKDH